MLGFKKSAPCFGSLFDDGVKQRYIQALVRIKVCKSKVDKENTVFKLLSNGNLCVANRNSNETMFKIGVFDKDINQLVRKPCEMSNVHRRIQLVELNKTVVLCLFDNDDGEDVPCSSRIVKYDFDLNFLGECEFAFEIIHANEHQDKLYLLARSSDRKSRHIYVYDESLTMLEFIQLNSSEGPPFYIPNTATRMRVAEKFFVFLDGTNVLLMDRLDGMIKRTFCIGSSDFVLDSRNDRVMAYDGKTKKLVCFDFEGESFEISISNMKNVKLVDYGHDRFMFCLYF